MSGSDAGDRELFDGGRHLDAALESLGGAHRPQSLDDQRANLVGRVVGRPGGGHATQVTDRLNGAAPSGAVRHADSRGDSAVARRPSRRHRDTRISSWVLGGEPCIEPSRVASSSMYALHVERGRDVGQIGDLYPQLDLDAITGAVDLETRLQAA